MSFLEVFAVIYVIGIVGMFFLLSYRELFSHRPIDWIFIAQNLLMSAFWPAISFLLLWVLS